jgi:hypothetical protein
MKCSCGRSMVAPIGKSDSKYGVTVDAPMFEDLQSYRLLNGRIGEALAMELAMVGIDMKSLWIVPMMGHLNSKECTHDHATDLLKSTKNCDAVLMMGSSALSAFGGAKASDLYGTVIKLPTLKASIVPAPSPGLLVSGELGEFRMAFKKFSVLMRRHK